MTNASSPRDMFVNIVSRAIKTGAKDPRARVNSRFYDGRVAGLITSAMVIAHMAYGCDPEATRTRIRLLVKDIRATWDTADRLDVVRTSQEAEAILDQVLLLPAAS